MRYLSVVIMSLLMMPAVWAQEVKIDWSATEKGAEPVQSKAGSMEAVVDAATDEAETGKAARTTMKLMPKAIDPSYEAYSLQKTLQAKQAGSKAKIDKKTAKIMSRSADRIEKLDIPSNSLQVGQAVSEFVLPAAGGDSVRLGKLLEKGPAVVTFYRGGWCPYCKLELQAYETALPEIEALGATLVAVAPETLENAQQTKESLNLSFDVLADQGNQTARAFGLVFEMPKKLRDVYKDFGIDLVASNGDETWELPVPATYVIAQDGTVAARFVDPDYKKRMDPTEVLVVLKELNRGE